MPLGRLGVCAYALPSLGGALLPIVFALPSQPRFRRQYDHRIRSAFVDCEDPALLTRFGVPAGTAKTWIRRGAPDVVSFDDRDHSDVARLNRRIRSLQRHNSALRKQCAALRAVVALLLTLVRITGAKLHRRRLAAAADKQKLLKAITKASATIGLKPALKILGLSRSRYYDWSRKLRLCGLEGLQDGDPCPKSRPTSLTLEERSTMHELVLSREHRHMSVPSLALWAQRSGKLLAPVSCWYQMIRKHGWKRPTTRAHPAAPTVGIRAEHPHQFWHIDVTVIRLLDGSRVFLHAVIDNFSRVILGWLVSEHHSAANTCAVLAQAERFLTGVQSTSLIVDAGSENVNSDVDTWLGHHQAVSRVLAQVDIAFSNSMIEAWWRSLKHNWLFLHQLDSIETVRKLVAFYVEQHNTVMPHSAFDGQTPIERLHGERVDCGQELAALRKDARERRIQHNRSLTCGVCRDAPNSTASVP